MRYTLLAIIGILILQGCSTHLTTVEYEGEGIRTNSSQPPINKITVIDQRNNGSNWIGAIRGGYGNPLKTLKTIDPVNIVVEKMITDALKKSNLYTDSLDANRTIEIKIIKFECQYYYNREAYADLSVRVINNTTSKAIYSKTYKTLRTEAGSGAGVFGSVETLRNLAEETMNNTIDKMLSDQDFIKSLLNNPS